MFHAFKEHTQYHVRKLKSHIHDHKERLVQHMHKIHGHIKYHVHRAKENVIRVIAHKYFYPIFFSSLAVSAAITFIATASPSEEILQEQCTYNESTKQYFSCGEYESLRVALTNSFYKITERIIHQSDTPEKEAAGLRVFQQRIVQVRNDWIARNAIEGRHIFVFALLEYLMQEKLMEYIAPLYPDTEIVVRTHNGSGTNTPYPYEASHQIFAGQESLLMQIKITNTTDITMQLKNLAVDIGTGDLLVSGASLQNIQLYDEDMLTRRDGAVDSIKSKIIWVPNVLLKPGNNIFYIRGTVESLDIERNKLQLFFDENNSVVVSDQGLYIEEELITNIIDISYIKIIH